MNVGKINRNNHIKMEQTIEDFKKDSDKSTQNVNFLNNISYDNQ